MISEADLVLAVKTELEHSSTSESSQFQQWRRDAEAYYRLEPDQSHYPSADSGEIPSADAPVDLEGRSKAQSPDVQSMVDQTIAQIMPRFQREILAEFEEMSADDAEQAKAETVAINKLILHQGGGYEAIRHALQDSLKCMIGASVVYWDDTPKVVIENVPDTTMVFRRSPDEEIEVIAEGKIRRTVPRGELIIKPIPLDQLRLAGDADSADADKARFIGYESFVGADMLIAQGVDPDIVDSLPDAEDSDQSETFESRDFRVQTGHASTTNKKITECWYKIDADEDGFAERRHIRISGDYVLYDEEVSDEVDIVLGIAFPQAHQAYGWSFYHKLKCVQDNKRTFLRQMIDNGQLAIDQRWLAEEGALNMDTMSHSRPGGIVLAEAGQIDRVRPLSAPDGTQSALPLMTYMDKIRSETGGNALDMTGQNLPVPGSTAHGTERIVTSMEQLVSDLSEAFARSYLKKLFVVAHRVLRNNSAPIRLSMQGQTVVVNAAMFPPREDVNVSLGPSISQRMQRMQALEMTVQRMLSPEVQGMGLTTPDRIHQALVDLGDAYELPGAASYWLDPNSEEAQMQQQQRQMQEMQAQQMAAQQAMEQQAMQMQLLQAQLALERAKIEQRQIEHNNDLDFKYTELMEKIEQQEADRNMSEDKLELEEQKAEADYEIDDRKVRLDYIKVARDA